ncbi:MAG: hypothetical protein SGILL_002359 [Bacillariaceae sp.]
MAPPPSIRHDPNSAYMNEEDGYEILAPGKDNADGMSSSDSEDDQDMESDVVRLGNTAPQPVKPAKGSAAYKAKKLAASSEPNEYDVYMGRGGLMNRFRNGSLYRRLILEKYEAYKHAPFKRDFAFDEIVKPVQAKGGRFFIPSNDLKGWVQGDIYEVIAPKVMQALRDCYKDEPSKPSGWSPPGATKGGKKGGKKPKVKTTKKRKSASSSSSSRKRQAPAGSNATASSYNHPANKIRQRVFAAPAPAPTPSPQIAKRTFGVAGKDSTPSSGSTPLRHNLLMSLGATPKEATSSQAAAANPASTTNDASPAPTPDPKKRVLLNEKGHMMNTVSRTTGVCGFYHFLLSHHTKRFASVDELEEGQFVWDNIVSPIQKQGGSILVCPKSGKVQHEVNHKTIICIATALRDKEYIAEECANPYGQPGSGDCGNKDRESKNEPGKAATPPKDSTNMEDQQKKNDDGMFAVARTAVIGLFRKEETSKPAEASKPTADPPKPALEAIETAGGARPAAVSKKIVPGMGSYNALKAQAVSAVAPPPSVLIAQTADAKDGSSPAPSKPATVPVASSIHSAATHKTAADVSPVKTAPSTTAVSVTTPDKEVRVPSSTFEETPTESFALNTVKKGRAKPRKEDLVATRQSSRIKSGGIAPASHSEPRPTRSDSPVTAALTTRPKRQASIASVTPEQSYTAQAPMSQPAKSHAELVPPTTLNRGKSQEAKLDESGRQAKTPWGERFSELVEYAKKNGNSNVPQRNAENPALGRYVKVNRQYWMRNRQRVCSPLTPEREALLDAMGFQWNMLIERSYQKTYSWELQLNVLKDFKKKWGHCDVPLVENNTRLARWVAYMRKLKNIDPTEYEGLGGVTISSDWQQKLEAVGFNWGSPYADSRSASDSEGSVSNDKPPVDKIRFSVPIRAPSIVTKPTPRPSPIAPVTAVAAPVASVRTVTDEIAKATESPKKKIMGPKTGIPKKPAASVTATTSSGGSINVNVLSNMESNFGNGKNWSQCFKMLSVFKEETGHTQVPYRRAPHNHPMSILSKFVMQQRVHKALKNRKHSNNLTEEREKNLNSIGFEWRTKYECTKEGAKAMEKAGNGVPPTATPRLASVAQKGEGRKDTKAAAKSIVEQPEAPTRTIVDSQGTKWTTYKPVSVDRLFNVSEASAVPARPPSPEKWGVEMAYESDDDSVTF